jgi:hypothetical protein
MCADARRRPFMPWTAGSGGSRKKLYDNGWTVLYKAWARNEARLHHLWRTWRACATSVCASFGCRVDGWQSVPWCGAWLEAG